MADDKKTVANDEVQVELQDENTTNANAQVAPVNAQAVDTNGQADKGTSPAEKDNIFTVETAPTEDELKAAADKRTEDAPSDFKASPHVTYHLDKDPNDPRLAEPARELPSLDDEVSRGPAHGRISNDGDHTTTGKNFPA